MREPPQKVVVNATPIIALALVGRLNLLQQLYDQVIVPPAVRDEILAGGPGAVGSGQMRQATWIRTVALQDPQRADLLSDLDRGEAEVLSLAQEVGADLVIIDERLARRHARRVGLRLTGTLGVLLKAKSLGFLTTVEPLVQQLRESGFHLSDAVVAKALELAGER